MVLEDIDLGLFDDYDLGPVEESLPSDVRMFRDRAEFRKTLKQKLGDKAYSPDLPVKASRKLIAAE